MKAGSKRNSEYTRYPGNQSCQPVGKPLTPLTWSSHFINTENTDLDSMVLLKYKNDEGLELGLHPTDDLMNNSDSETRLSEVDQTRSSEVDQAIFLEFDQSRSSEIEQTRL